MVTKVGTESDLKGLLTNLILLEHDAIGAYKAGIDQLEDDSARDKFKEFIKDHDRHIEDLTPHLTGTGGEVPVGSSTKSVLTEGKVKIAGLVGDRAILKAMMTNEIETVMAYQQALDNEQSSGELTNKLQAALDDEKRHKAWMQDNS